MADHYAVCLSVSQGAYDTRASCHLLFADQHFETMMCIEWPTLPPQSDPENPGEWLFHVLEDLVTNFDAHAVLSAERRPRDGHGRA
jgi:hypothetical protein